MVYINSSIIQKVISEYSYNILMICKKEGEEFLPLQEYIKKEYLNSHFLSYSQLYDNLLQVILDICSEKQIQNILLTDLRRQFDLKIIQERSSELSVCYEDLCKMLIRKLELLQVREKVEDVYIDLFLIDVEGKVYSMEDYDNSVKNEEIRRVKTR